MNKFEKNEIIKGASNFLNSDEIERLQALLNEIESSTKLVSNNEELIKLFETSKNVEGCSPKSMKYYLYVLNTFFDKVKMDIKDITTDDIRNYLDNFTSRISKVSLDNIRRILSSFFSWLEEENYISKNPVRRIHKIKSLKTIKKTFNDEIIENLKDNCTNIRDRVIIELLASTGMRVGELVNLDISSIDFENKECVVLGKGGKQRKVYFDSKTKLHLKKYLNSRMDENTALFVSLSKPYNRLQISGVEIMLRKLGKKLNIAKVHPHKFRRTLATRAIDKGMPVEQLQVLLGHTKIDTTMHYAIVDQTNVKISYKKYIE